MSDQIAVFQQLNEEGIPTELLDSLPFGCSLMACSRTVSHRFSHCLFVLNS
ncbi:MAG: hypothetical protein JNL70_17040 [Saprospiraceae bacterium]|nr:hypothetical protein [Saprospiraceae bacterium]